MALQLKKLDESMKGALADFIAFFRPYFRRERISFSGKILSYLVLYLFNRSQANPSFTSE